MQHETAVEFLVLLMNTNSAELRDIDKNPCKEMKWHEMTVKLFGAQIITEIDRQKIKVCHEHNFMSK